MIIYKKINIKKLRKQKYSFNWLGFRDWDLFKYKELIIKNFKKGFFLSINEKNR